MSVRSCTGLLVLGMALCATSLSARASEAPADVALATIPERVCKEEDGLSGKTPSEGWVFYVLVREQSGGDLVAKSATAELYAGTKLLETVRFTESALATLRDVTFKAGPREPEVSAKRYAAQEEVFDLRHQFSTPVALDVSSVVYRLELATPEGRRNLGVPPALAVRDRAGVNPRRRRP